jgi:hypothetical protein
MGRADQDSVVPGIEVNPVKEIENMRLASFESGASAMAEFIDLLLYCPKGDSLECCPFSEVRKLSFEEKAIWVMSQPKDEILKILSLHRNCMLQTLQR